jgi:hypothetical protein
VTAHGRQVDELRHGEGFVRGHRSSVRHTLAVSHRPGILQPSLAVPLQNDGAANHDRLGNYWSWPQW